MVSFKKPTAALHMPRLTGGKTRYTDTMSPIGLGVTIAYKSRGPGTDYPTRGQKANLLEAAKRARTMVRVANDELAKVTILRKDEPAWFTDTLDTHFGLIEGDDSGGWLSENRKNRRFAFKRIFKKDRRWVINKIRENMLSLSFHLNTGLYLIDQDAANRDIVGGRAAAADEFEVGDEAYVMVNHKKAHKHLCGFRNGEIHIDFEYLQTYSVNSVARIIIHEAAHKYLGASDYDGDGYAHSDVYQTLSLKQCLDNADSHAWTAVSLYSQAVKMGDPNSSDWENCA